MSASVLDELFGHLQCLNQSPSFEQWHVPVGPWLFHCVVDPASGFDEFIEPFFEARPNGKLKQSSVGCEDRSDRSADLTVYVLHANQLPRYMLDQLLSEPMQWWYDAGKRSDTERWLHLDQRRGLVKVFDPIGGYALLCVMDVNTVPAWEHHAPMKEFIHLFALTQQCFLFHGAALLVHPPGDTSVLVVGPGGAGKSTMTAFAMTQGCLTHGDDYVLMDLRGDRPCCWAIYRTIKLHTSNPIPAHELRGLRPWRQDPSTQKNIMLAADGVQGELSDASKREDHPRKTDCSSSQCGFVDKSHVTRVYGIGLAGNADTNDRASQHPYLYGAMSTVAQLPYRLETFLGLVKRLYDKVGYVPYTTEKGLTGLAQTLERLRQDA